MGVGLGGVGAQAAATPISNFWNWANGQIPTYQGNSQIGQSILEQNIPTAYFQYKANLGIPDSNTAFSRWFDQQLGKYNLGYNAFTAANPLTANIGDYNNTLGGFDAWRKQFMNMDPTLRGEDPSSRGAGPVRWIRS